MLVQAFERLKPELQPKQQRVQIALDADGIGVDRQPHALTEAGDVRIDGNAGRREAVAEHDVGGLASDARQRHQHVARFRDLAAVLGDEFFGQCDQVLRLGAVKADGLDLRFEARFAWQAALATADDEESARLKSKIESGLTKATAAP